MEVIFKTQIVEVIFKTQILEKADGTLFSRWVNRQRVR